MRSRAFKKGNKRLQEDENIEKKIKYGMKTAKIMTVKKGAEKQEIRKE